MSTFGLNVRSSKRWKKERSRLFSEHTRFSRNTSRQQLRKRCCHKNPVCFYRNHIGYRYCSAARFHDMCYLLVHPNGLHHAVASVVNFCLGKKFRRLSVLSMSTEARCSQLQAKILLVHLFRLASIVFIFLGGRGVVSRWCGLFFMACPLVQPLWPAFHTISAEFLY